MMDVVEVMNPNMSKKLQLKFPVLAPGKKPEESIHSLKKISTI